MEATPDQKRKFTDYFHGQQDGTGPAPSGPTRPGQKLTDHIHHRLLGDAMPDTFTIPLAGVDPAVWKAAQEAILDPNSPEYHLASTMIHLAEQLDALQGSQP